MIVWMILSRVRSPLSPILPPIPPALDTMEVASLLHQSNGLVSVNLTFASNSNLFVPSLSKSLRFGDSFRLKHSRISAVKKQLPPNQYQKTDAVDNKDKLSRSEDAEIESVDSGWLPVFPHVLTASMSNFLFGYHIGVMNGPIISIARELGFEGNSILEGLVVSIFIVGAFIGSLISGSLVDKFGCRQTLQLVTIPLIAGAILSGQAHSVDEVLWGRFLVGLGIGVNTVLVPIYISEVAPTKYRGSLGTVCQLGTCLGIIASLFIGIPAESDTHWWRTMLYIASIPGFVLALGMQFAVESPRWLCKVGRLNDAKAIIYNLWGPSEVDKAIEEFQLVMKSGERDLGNKWLELLQEPHSRVAFIGGALFLLQQFAGINGVLYFSSLTFQDVGIASAALASLYVGLTNFAGALSALYLIDKQGRRRLLIGSYLGMAISMFLIVYAISAHLDENLSHNLSILGTLMYIFTFAVGAGPVTGLIIPELSSNRTRGTIMGFSFSVHWVCNFLVGLFFLELVEKFGIAPVYSSFGVKQPCHALPSRRNTNKTYLRRNVVEDVTEDEHEDDDDEGDDDDDDEKDEDIQGSANYLLGAFKSACHISIVFADEKNRKKVPIKKENGQTFMVPLFQSQENIAGKMSVKPVQRKKIEHNGIKVEPFGQIGYIYYCPRVAR
ncbi:hypothetical protein Nepgr_000545 [Nepenthes gracilis]|uniref:Major facilitator superfamily (MFS) profile domain-containing protein n=1 Tax=Nepenthes gracilis TaxID=150966 RepID=A0AAD3P364_NEPGR|nr:hypothetical protein Nepgr_000545 [Nepenthes gracilis]